MSHSMPKAGVKGVTYGASLSLLPQAPLICCISPQVLSDMLELVRDHAENAHSSYLEWIVIILVAICVFVGIFEVMGTVGLVGPGGHFRPKAAHRPIPALPFKPAR